MGEAVAIHDQHSIEIRRTELNGCEVVGLMGVCTCGWRSGTHQIYLGASTDWAEQRAHQAIERARTAHLRSLTP